MGEFERSDLRNEWEISNMRKCINEVFDPGYVFWLESKMIDFIDHLLEFLGCFFDFVEMVEGLNDCVFFT